MGALKQQKFIISQLWNLKVQHQVIERVKLYLKLIWHNPFLLLVVCWHFLIDS